MNTRVLLTASAVVMGALGVAGLFLPEELLRAAGVTPAGIVPALVQLLGASMFAFAMVNWTARGSLLGGIYNRAVAIGNVTHFVVSALVFDKLLFAGERHLAIIVVALVYTGFAVCFSVLFFGSPVKR